MVDNGIARCTSSDQWQSLGLSGIDSLLVCNDRQEILRVSPGEKAIAAFGDGSRVPRLSELVDCRNQDPVADRIGRLEPGTSLSFPFLTSDATGRPVEREMMVVRTPGKGYVAAIRSARPTQKQEAALLESERRYRLLFDHVWEGIAHCRMIYRDGQPADFVYLEVNAAFERLTGLRDVVGKAVSEVIPGVHQSNPELLATYARVARTGVPEAVEITLPMLGITFQISVFSSQRDHFIAVFENVTERKAIEAKSEFLAYHDPLTRLPNRLLATDRFKMAVAGAMRDNTRIAVLFLDLDHFKTVNDSLGHSVGDQLLVGAAQRLTQCTREIDTVSRQGGDEFVLILPEIRDLDELGVLLDRILHRVGEPVFTLGHELSNSASIGVAMFPDDGDDFETLLRKADTALYHAKDDGRNLARFYSTAMEARALERLKARSSLRQALENHEFELFYQPQVDLSSGAICGAEALLRWRHPVRGLVAPAAFIGAAEETGQIVQIGEWVLRQACRQAAAWRAAGLPPITVAVNLSSVQLRRGQFEQTVASALEEAGLEGSGLELEFTESVFIKDSESVLATVHALKQLGVHLSIDDFGTGYSSLAYIKRLDVDKLKIDRSFVRDMAGNPDDAAIVRAVVQMAKTIGLRTVAEGVEEADQELMLHRFGCDEAQGFLYSKPVPAAEFLGYWLRHERVISRIEPALSSLPEF